jgi:hypothetical protein
MTKILTVKPGDPDFVITDGFILSSRAEFQISEDCPGAYMSIIQKCVQEGWLKPIAHMRDSELMWGTLSNEIN